MNSQVTLEQALKTVYKKRLKPKQQISSNWSLFEPYQLSSKKVVYFRLLELPNQYHTSSEIYTVNLKKYPQLLHKVELTFVERSFRCGYYLVKTDKNVSSIKNLIQLRQITSEQFSEDFLYEFLQFAASLQQFPSIPGLTHEDVGVTSDGKFILTKYSLLFKNQAVQEFRLKQDIQRLLASMILLRTDNKYNLSQLFSECLQRYSESLLCVVKKSIESDFEMKEIVEQIRGIREMRNYERKTTLTDSFNSTENKESYLTTKLIDESQISETLTQSFHEVKAKKKLTTIKLTLSVIFFLFLISIAAFITIKYIGHNVIICAETEYLDSSLNRCFSCSSTCQRCESGGDNECLSCGIEDVLVKRNEDEKTGSCSKHCNGYLSEKTVCIDPNK